jgi:pantoate--beta-alanine ligase
VRKSLVDTIATEPAARLDYAAVVNADTLLPVERVGQGEPALLAVAVWIGKTRLIDNVVI